MSLLTFIFWPSEIFTCNVIFVPKMVKLQLGVGAQVWVLMSRLHPKDVISKAYPNYTKANKAEGWLLHLKAQNQFIMRRRWLWCFVMPPNTSRHKNSIVGHYITSFMSQKKEMNKDCSLSQTVQVRIILRKHKGHNKTPTTQSS